MKFRRVTPAEAQRAYDNQLPNEEHYRPCPACSGSGNVDGHACGFWNCNGSGEIYWTGDMPEALRRQVKELDL